MRTTIISIHSAYFPYFDPSLEALEASRIAIKQLIRAKTKVDRLQLTLASSKAKVNIIQALVSNGIDIAGDVYKKNKKVMNYADLREVSSFVHHKYKTDKDIIPFYLPNLPDPYKSVEWDKLEVKHERDVQESLETSQKELDQLQKAKRLRLELGNCDPSYRAPNRKSTHTKQSY